MDLLKSVPLIADFQSFREWYYYEGNRNRLGAHYLNL